MTPQTLIVLSAFLVGGALVSAPAAANVSDAKSLCGGEKKKEKDTKKPTDDDKKPADDKKPGNPA
jgi:hypothetical protein